MSENTDLLHPDDRITHKLKISWEDTKYITLRQARFLFDQFNDEKNTQITIKDPKTLTYITKYRSQIDLVPLDEESNDLEDLLFRSWLPESWKDEFRSIVDLRKRERKPITTPVIVNILETMQKKRIKQKQN